VHARVATLLLEQTARSPLHAPQWLGSVAMSTSHPSERRLLLQSRCVPMHVPPLHEPRVQFALMKFVEHAAPQAPQFAIEVARFDSHPFVSLSLSQSPKPKVQAPLHVPALHVGLVMWFAEQALHPPQWVASVVVS
jgi:hypothetical protein